MPEPSRVSVVIVSYNRSADLRLAIEAVVRSAWPDKEIIVVDNASTDDAAQVAASFGEVKLIRNETNTGFAEGCNIGLAHATGEFVALVNNDAVIEDSWIEQTAGFLQARPEAAAVGTRTYFWDDANPLGNRDNGFYGYTKVDPETGFNQPTVSQDDEEREVATLSGAVVMIRRKAIDDAGAPFLEPTFFAYYEETDFFARAIRKGWRLYYRSSPVSWHRVRASTASQPYAYYYWMARNRLLYAYRNFDEAQLQRVLRDAWLDAWSIKLRGPLGKRMGDKLKAKRDAYRWVSEHKELLQSQRSEVMAKGGSYNQRVREIESRAGYYGYCRPEVAALVPPDASCIVDVGCGAGALGRSIKAQRPNAQVRGIEPVASQAQRARKALDDVFVGGLEAGLPQGWPRPDCVVFADVLEHVVDPWSALKTWREALKPGGTVVISLPNAAHREVMGELISGRLRYKDAGVLDRTHLRFFTRDTAVELVEQAGFRLKEIRRVIDMPRRGWKAPIAWWAEQRSRNEQVHRQRALVDTIQDLCTVQFLLVGERP
ncbi:MAG: glycosyltransferase [Deltaproteobacteria bacterium]|nr:glycosyltransferase [Deltaproteobacteria bacterium]